MTSEETPQPTSSDPVGQQLQRAREQRGLSADDVAKAQHLRPAVIQAIEAGDYKKIDSELFLKGYVRAYAKQVGLEASDVIADLDRELEPMRQEREQEFEANPLVDIERRRRRKRRVAKLALLLCVAGLAGYLVFAFVLPQPETVSPSGVAEKAGQEEPAYNGSGNETESAAPEIDGAAGMETEEAAEPASEPEPENATDDSNGAAQVTDEVAGTQVTEPLEPMAEDSVTSDQTVDPIESAPVVTQTTDPLLEDPAEPVVVTDTGRLQITFTGDCWVQVSDAAGNRLVNSLQRSGDQIDVSGEVPLRVVIGAVDAVGSISFQGEPVDMGGYPVVNNRSEFTLTI
ncbi:RodZ domain-containing protein [Marinobacter sp. F4218]|uniref:RodZ domain-containing protein n=1 Tax=Marinobacter sp. F4218 TaxID=2862868 RepID=UPI001C63667F|nr:RodZ domain-containing protein [Marinobacter sp. F4218]MBW7469609.1 DUF4115 domain-containing protein [Marinobacter sp. F4218]